MSTQVKVWITSPDTHSERRYDLHMSVKELKSKLEFVTGIAVDAQVLSLYRSGGDPAPIRTLDDDARPLGYYGVADGMLIKIHDINPSASLTGQFTDVSQVEKFEISEQEYAKRDDTVLAFKRRNKIGRFAEPTEGDSQVEPEEQVDIQVGSRCEVQIAEDTMKKRGVVRYVGRTKFGKAGITWVGVEYDEPVGKHDGVVQNERYFTCPPLHGAFVRAAHVKVGDFPPIDVFAEEEEM
ncbi:hypothetical protein BOTBODRAFT_153331 [Botryobasidium botryosum FD-172 SS1]|uniref:CAP-Gly domain-containing protein n=1 Tax=Botryobasidium botryosum (strain FD-172 SS1) TaxID=930990 RepID=A0A067N5M5_BOTB1|nr:hypothetical protein BOTBODRAFT_153331 [Botryobasidium botryosum FD-172 SS1]